LIGTDVRFALGLPVARVLRFKWRRRLLRIKSDFAVPPDDRCAPEAALGGLEIQLPLYPRKL